MKRRNLRKGMAMAMATAMAFTTAFGTAPLQVAKAADSQDIGKVEWDSASYRLQISVDQNVDGIYVANSSVGSTLKVPASTKYEWIENDGVGDMDNNKGSITLDLSWLPASSQYVFVATDTDDIDAVAKAKSSEPATDAQKAKIKVLKVDKAPTLAASYVGAIDTTKKFKNVAITTDSAIKLSEGYFVFTVKTATGSAFRALSKDEVEDQVCGEDFYRYGEDGIETDGYAVKGKKFSFGYVPENGWVTDKTLTNAASSEILTVGRVSKLISVKLPAKKGAPAVKAEYKKDTVKLPKGAEYKVTKSGDTEADTWTQVGDAAKTVEIAKLAPNSDATDVTIKVRTAATAKAPSSKARVIKVKAQTTTTSAAIQTSSDVLVASKGAFSISFKKAYDATSGIVLTNFTSDKYDYALVSKADLKGTISSGVVQKDSGIDWSKISWKSVAAPAATAAAGKTATISASTYSKSGVLKANDYVILYRNVGNGKYTQRAEIKAVELKDIPTLAQKMSLKAGDAAAVEITSGTSIQAVTSATTGGAIGTVTIDKATKKATEKYAVTTAVYSDEKCTTSATGLNLTVTKKTDGVDLGVNTAANKKSTAGTYYVKIIIEGSVGVIKVEVK